MATALRRALRQRTEATPLFGFLDETGTLGGERDPFFAVGLLRCEHPYSLLRPVQRLRDRHSFYDEMKWNKVSAKKLPILTSLVDIMFGCDCQVSAFVVDKRVHDVIGRFGDQFGAYEALARQLVKASVRHDQTLWIVADEYSTPPTVTFEENVRDYVNARLGRQAVAGVCRMRSSGVDLLQLLDIVLGAIVYEYKAESGVVDFSSYKPKVRLLEHIKQTAGVPSFVGGYRDGRLNVAEYRGRTK